MHSLLIQALRCQNHSRPPVWFMRQAGRYMASYRSLRERYSFLEMCHEPELILQVTKLPVEEFGVDAAILFSDILVIPEAMQRGLHFEERHGPVIERPICRPEDVYALPKPDDLEPLLYVKEGIDLLKKELKVPLIGFCGAPFTVASYLIEGGSSSDLKKTKKWMLTHPQAFRDLLQIIADWSVAYLKMQVAAGVEAIQIFDSWAEVLAYVHFQDYALASTRLIVERLKPLNIPIILFSRRSSLFASQLATLQPAGISLDWNCDMAQIRRLIPYPIALQGNLDPDFLYAPSPSLKTEVHRILEGMRGDRGFIFNLGHGIAPDVSEEAIRLIVDWVKQF